MVAPDNQWPSHSSMSVLMSLLWHLAVASQPPEGPREAGVAMPREDRRSGTLPRDAVALHGEVAEGSQGPPPVFMTREDLRNFPGAQPAAACLAASPQDPKLPRPHGHLTCAVVGRAPNSKGSGNGPRIDGHSAVFRAGLCGPGELGPLAGDLGQRTDYCVAFWDRTDLGPQTQLVVPAKTMNLIKNGVASPTTCRNGLLATHPRFLSSLDRRLDEWDKAAAQSWRLDSIFYDPRCEGVTGGSRACRQVVNLSSGFLAVMLAMEMCVTVDVFGFDTDTSIDAPYKHVDNPWARPNGRSVVEEHPHAFPLERKLLKHFHAERMVRLDPSTRLLTRRTPYAVAAGGAAVAAGASTNSSAADPYVLPW